MSPPEPTIFGSEARIPPNALPARTGLLYGTTGRTADGNVFVAGYTWQAGPDLLDKLESWGKRLPHTQIYREGSFVAYGVRTEGFTVQTDAEQDAIVRDTLNWAKKQVFLASAGDLPEPTSAGPLLPFKLVRDTTTALTPDELGFRPADDPTAHFGLLTSRELDEGDFDEEWLIDDLLVEGQPGVIGGPEKVLKTSIIVDAATSLSSGKPFLGRFPVLKRCCVLVMTAESGLAAIQGTARRVCAAKGIKLSDLDIIWSPRLPQLADPRDLGRLEQAISKYGARIVAIDPAYLCLGGDDHGNVFKMGLALGQVREVCGRAGASPLMAHHGTKGVSPASDSPISLTDLSQAGFREWAGTWWLLNRRTDYQAGEPHKLWLRAGSRSGDSYDYALDIYEGLRKDYGGKVWRIDRIIERCELKKEDAKRDLEQGIAGVITFLAEFSTGRAFTPIMEGIDRGKSDTQAILDHMESEGLVVPCQVPDRGSKTKTLDGYKLPEGEV